MQGLAVALDDEAGELVAVAEVAGEPDVDVGVPGRPRPGLVGDPARQHAVEQEVRRDHDAARTERPAAAQAGRDVGAGERDERGLDLVRSALLQQPRDLAHLGVGVRVGRPAADEQHGGVVARHTLERRADPVDEDLLQHGVRAEGAAEHVPGGRVPAHLALQRGRDVPLGVPGGDEHQRHGRQPAVAATGQRGPRLVHGRLGQLDEPAVDVHSLDGEHASEPVGERDELRHPLRVDRAVADEQQGGHAISSE